MPTALPGVPEPCCHLSLVTWAWIKGSVGSGFGQVMPGDAVYHLGICRWVFSAAETKFGKEPRWFGEFG